MSVRHISVRQIICRTDKSYDADFFFFKCVYISTEHVQLHNTFNNTEDFE